VAGGEFVGASKLSIFMSGCIMVGGSSESKLSGVAGGESVGASKLSKFMIDCKMNCVPDSSVSTGGAGGEFVGSSFMSGCKLKLKGGAGGEFGCGKTKSAFGMDGSDGLDVQKSYFAPYLLIFFFFILLKDFQTACSIGWTLDGRTRIPYISPYLVIFPIFPLFNGKTLLCD
jgi:hypothetical protein